MGSFGCDSVAGLLATALDAAGAVWAGAGLAGLTAGVAGALATAGLAADFATGFAAGAALLRATGFFAATGAGFLAGAAFFATVFLVLVVFAAGFFAAIYEPPLPCRRDSGRSILRESIPNKGRDYTDAGRQVQRKKNP